MRHLLTAAVVAPSLVLAGPVAAQTALPPPAPPVADAAPGLPLVAGIGAIAGVIGFNVLALGLPALPGIAAAPVVAAEMSVAMSRVYATVSAVWKCV